MAEVQNSSDYVSLGQYNNPAGIQVRIDTTELLEQYKRYLAGVSIKVKYDENGEIVGYDEIPTGHQLANAKGVDGIMFRVSSIVNKHSVQGNTDDDQYNQFIIRAHKSMAYNVMLNLYEWGISVHDYHQIVDSAMDLIELVTSRTIDNEERESYRQTVKHEERSTHVMPKSSVPYFGG